MLSSAEFVCVHLAWQHRSPKEDLLDVPGDIESDWKFMRAHYCPWCVTALFSHRRAFLNSSD